MNKNITETELIIKRFEELIKKGNEINSKKLTPYRVAKNGELETSTLNKILDRTNKDIRASTVGKLCKGLDISLRDFFDDDLFK